jgi:hypothetical protein
MNKIKSTLFTAVFIAITAITTLAADGHIPIAGRPVFESDKTTATTSNATIEPENEIPFEISNYLWTFADIIGQLKF